MTQTLPKLDLTTFFLSISSAAMMYLGVKGPSGSDLSEPKTDLVLAKQNIDLLELMKEKTAGNRTPEEDHLLDQLLYTVRMRYLEIERMPKK